MIRSSLLVVLLQSGLLFSQGPWLQKSSLPGPGRHRLFSFVINDKAYVGGGWNGLTMWNDFWEYDPASNSWTQRATLPTTAWTSQGFSLDNKGFVVGGTLTGCICYDPITNQWSARNAPPADIFWESQLWIFNNQAWYPNQGVIYIYNAISNSWLSQATFGGVFNGSGTSFQTTSRAYCCFIGSTWNQTWEFNPTNYTWTQKALFPGETRTQAYAFGVNGKGYAGCGDGTINDNLNDFWEYDPVANLWTRIPDLPGATRENFTAWNIGSKGYICAGTNGVNMQDLWEFDPDQIDLGWNSPESPEVKLLVYPNPSEGDVRAELSGFEDLRKGETVFRLYELTGQCVLTIAPSSENFTIPRGSLAAGCYQYVVNAGGRNIATGKLVFR